MSWHALDIVIHGLDEECGTPVLRWTELMNAMSDISQKHWCAGWMGGLEYSLWAMLMGGDRDFGCGDVSPEDLRYIATLARAIDGWVVAREFVPMAQWLDMYEAWDEGRTAAVAISATTTPGAKIDPA